MGARTCESPRTGSARSHLGLQRACALPVLFPTYTKVVPIRPQVAARRHVQRIKHKVSRQRSGARTLSPQDGRSAGLRTNRTLGPGRRQRDGSQHSNCRKEPSGLQAGAMASAGRRDTLCGLHYGGLHLVARSVTGSDTQCPILVAVA